VVCVCPENHVCFVCVSVCFMCMCVASVGSDTVHVRARDREYVCVCMKKP